MKIAIFLGLMIGNYIYQLFGGQDYPEAFKITFFQGIAIGAISWFESKEER